MIKKKDLLSEIKDLIRAFTDGITAGTRNMLSVALATAAAGIVVGIVTMGIGGMIVEIVETLSGGNLFLMLFITAIASLILGMGLPTTATYIVMASITAPGSTSVLFLFRDPGRRYTTCRTCCLYSSSYRTLRSNSYRHSGFHL